MSPGEERADGELCEKEKASVDGSLFVESNKTETQKYNAYVPYCTNDKNTTIGMPHVDAKIEPCTQKRETSRDSKNEHSIEQSPSNSSFIEPPRGAERVSGDPEDEFAILSTLSVGSTLRFHTHRGQCSMHDSEISLVNEIEMEVNAEKDIVNVALSVDAFSHAQRLHLTEDVYSFIFACSYFSKEYALASYFILLKYVCFGILLSGIRNDSVYNGLPIVQIIKLFLIPVAVTMQEDLMTVYYNAANIKYDGLVIKKHKHATWFKWVLSNGLRLVDGLLSLGVNFGVMLMTNTILSIFLNFAALHFLQFIDDVIYKLAEKGFFGDELEAATILCKHVTLSRRTASNNNSRCDVTNLDTMLMFLTALTCFIIYAIVQAFFYWDDRDNWAEVYENGTFIEPGQDIPDR